MAELPEQIAREGLECSRQGANFEEQEVRLRAAPWPVTFRIGCESFRDVMGKI